MTAQETLRVSVIVPTMGKRPGYLKRAIESCRSIENSIVVSVIIVVNGPGADSFDLPSDILRSAEKWNIRLKIEKISDANVSLARNRGLALADGTLIRFLDDDDFLLPDAACKQYLELANSASDLSTYAGRIEDSSGMACQVVSPERFMDYGEAVLGPKCPALTFATVYKAEVIRTLRWNESYKYVEDEDWMRCILRSIIPSWIQSDTVVGIWYQHSGERLSAPVPRPEFFLNRANSIMLTLRSLESSGRLTDHLKNAAASGLWSAVHGGFYFSPFYWTGVSKIARHLDNRSRPRIPLFTFLPKMIPPILVEWIILPKRLVSYLYRFAREKTVFRNPVRRV